MDRKDLLIIKAIGVEVLSASEISRKTGIGRTTIAYRLRLLRQRRFVAVVHMRGRDVRYMINKRAVNRARESRLIEVYEGDDVVFAYRSVVYAKDNSIIFSVQGLDALKHAFKFFSEDFLHHAHRIQRRRKILIKGFMNENISSLLASIDEGKLKSHLGRAVGVKMLSGDIFLGSCEVICSPNALLMCHYKKKHAIVIKEKGIVGLWYEIFSLLFHVSDHIRVFHMNEYLKTLIKEKELF